MLVWWRPFEPSWGAKIKEFDGKAVSPTDGSFDRLRRALADRASGILFV